MANPRSAAIFTVNHADEMTLGGRLRIARWMLRQALMLLRYGPRYGGRFTARYLYRQTLAEAGK